MVSVALFKAHPQRMNDADARLCCLRKTSYGWLLFRLLLFASRLLLLRLKQRSIFAVAFFLQFFCRNKAQRGRVYAESLTGRGGAIVEEVAEMRIARFSADLGALHSVRSIALFCYIL